MAQIAPQVIQLTPQLQVKQKHHGQNASIREPKKIGCYSIQKGPEGRSYFDDSRELRMIKMPHDMKRVQFDLKDGYIPLKNGGKVFGSCQTDDEPGLKDMLKWIRDHQNLFALNTPSEKSTPLNTDFITYRGVLSKIMVTPYERNEDFLICASKFRGTIYLYAFDTDYKKRMEEDVDDKRNLFCYGGHRFEDYVTKPVYPQDAKAKKDYGFQNEFCCMVRTRLGDHSFAFGAEMDCIRSNPSSKTDPQLSDFIELKTQATIKHERQLENLKKYKWLKWWAQSYLAGTERIVCGFRGDDMVIRSLQNFTVKELPHDAECYWSKIVCVNFLNDFLTFVKSVVVTDDPRLIYSFVWAPQEPVTCTTTRDPKYRVIPDWFIETFDGGQQERI